MDPIALIYTDDNYYLRCYNQARADYRNYRIDRMDDVQHLDTYIGDEAIYIKPQEDMLDPKSTENMKYVHLNPLLLHVLLVTGYASISIPILWNESAKYKNINNPASEPCMQKCAL